MEHLGAYLIVVMLTKSPVVYPMYNYEACTGLRDYIVQSELIVSARCIKKNEDHD